jgi:endonuclease/exonuclease/phosphatase family metal-dependent hydrolase
VLRQLSADLGLHSVAARLPREERWSWEGERYPRAMLDHILVSRELLPYVDDVSIGDAAVGASSSSSGAASDHRPLMLSLRTGEADDASGAGAEGRHEEL